MANWQIDFARARDLIFVVLGFLWGMTKNFFGAGERPEVLVSKGLQRLGMTYLKLGQFLALRIDLLPPEWCTEFGKLFEQVTPMTAAEVRQVIESELGGRVEAVFSRFEWEPVAAASVAQVHKALTFRGEQVAVKVQRPEVQVYFRSDVRNLNRLAAMVDALRPIGSVRLKDVAAEFANFTRRELDFITEGRAAERMREEAVYGERIPHIIWNLTSRRVLTMGFIEGVSLAKVKALVDAHRMDAVSALLPGADLHKAMRNMTRASLHQLLVTGFFHADLHPGNVLLCPGNQVAFLDFGIFGLVSAEQRERMANHIEQIALGNIDESFRHYSAMFTPTARTDYPSFARGAKAVLRRWFESSRNPDSPTDQRLVARFSEEMFAVVRAHYLTMSMDALLFGRALIILDATVLQLWPGFDLLEELRLFFARHRPGAFARLRQMADVEAFAPVLQLTGSLPGHLEKLLADLTLHRLNSRITVEESVQLRRSEDRDSKTIAIVLFGISLALLRRVVDPGYARVTLVVLTMACLILPLVRPVMFQRIRRHKRNART